MAVQRICFKHGCIDDCGVAEYEAQQAVLLAKELVKAQARHVEELAFHHADGDHSVRVPLCPDCTKDKA